MFAYTRYNKRSTFQLGALLNSTVLRVPQTKQLLPNSRPTKKKHNMAIKYARDLPAGSVNQIERVALVGVSAQITSIHRAVVLH